MKDHNEELEQYRLEGREWGGEGMMGCFVIPSKGCQLRVISSGSHPEEQWEHVSVSIHHRCPNWEEMSRVKDLFWGKDETVAQFHPKQSEYVNYHPYTLHLWKKRGSEFELPPADLVGPKERRRPSGGLQKFMAISALLAAQGRGKV